MKLVSVLDDDVYGMIQLFEMEDSDEIEEIEEIEKEKSNKDISGWI